MSQERRRRDNMEKIKKIKNLRPLWQWFVLYSTAWAILCIGFAVIIGLAKVGMDTSALGYLLIVIFVGVASVYWHWHFKMKAYAIMGVWTKPLFAKLKKVKIAKESALLGGSNVQIEG